MSKLSLAQFVAWCGLINTPGTAFAGPFDHLDPRACKVVSKKQGSAVCAASNANVVNTAKPDAKNMKPADFSMLRKMGYRPQTTDAREIGLLQDKAYEPTFYYARILRDETGTIVGVLDIAGYLNEEMGKKVQVALRLNIRGRLTKISLK